MVENYNYFSFDARYIEKKMRFCYSVPIRHKQDVVPKFYFQPLLFTIQEFQ